MHRSARHFGRLFFETYVTGAQARILDVGSLVVLSPDPELNAISGSLRDFAPVGACYVGADLVGGNGVDVVLPGPGVLPFRDGAFDAVVSTSCLEHDVAFWTTFEEMARVTAVGGLIYINAPSNGVYHRYPLDCWRFYPDAPLGLAAWACRQGREVSLLESFVGAQEADVWNDCVMVFTRGPSRPGPRLTDRIGEGHRNIHRPDRSRAPEAFSPETEDQALIAAARRAAAPASEQTAYGWIDGLAPDGVSGWVASSEPGQPAIVLARLDGAVVGTASADGFRSDLVAAGHAQTGFTLRLRIPMTGRDLLGRLHVEAMLEGESCGRVPLTPQLAATLADTDAPVTAPAAKRRPLAAYVPAPGLSLLDMLQSDALDPLFLGSFRTDVQSAWYGHVPFAHWLVGVQRPREIVELGTHFGVSYFAFCHAVLLNALPTRCRAVDTWQGDLHAGFYGDEVFDDVAQFNAEHCPGFSTLLRTTFDDACRLVDDGTVDLLHIDGLHTYEAVRHDFESWLPKMSARGIMLFHDIEVRTRGFGVWRLWDELAARYPSFSFPHSSGLGVLAVGPDVADQTAALCGLAGTPGAERIRAKFRALGELVRLTSHPKARPPAELAQREVVA